MFIVYLAVCLAGTPAAACDQGSPRLLSWTVIGEAPNAAACGLPDHQHVIAQSDLVQPGETCRIVCRPEWG